MTNDPIHLAFALVWLAVAIGWQLSGHQGRSLVCVAIVNVWLAT